MTGTRQSITVISMNIFTYGSLMFPDVWRRVTGLMEPGGAATLADHAARRIRGQSYPALVQEPGTVVDGVIYRGVTPEAVAALDAFEGSFYRRIAVDVHTADGPTEPAWVYLASEAGDPDILPEAWEAGRFARESLTDFLRADPGITEKGRA